MKKIVVAPDSFKGSLTSAEVADAVERGIKDVFPQCNVVKAGVADGGEGTVEAIVKAVGGDMYAASVTDPLGRPVKAAYGIVRSGGVKTAVMEMSAASGLPLLLPDELNPWITSTYGTGEMISDALNRGCRKFLVGIGGAFKAFLNARLTAGIEMVLDAIAFDSLLEGADLVITGEGRIDAQTAAGKTAAGVLRHAARKGIPVIAIGGSVAMCRELKEMGFIGIYSIINAPVSLEQAMRQDWATARIRCTVEQILTTMKHCAGTLLFQKGGD